MTRITLFLSLMLTFVFPQTGQAQLLGGIFSQSATDLKLVGEQIALLQVYIGWIAKGYGIAREGLTAIGNIKKGDFDLHASYFTSLKTVNPTIQRAKIIALIIEREARLLRYCQAAKTQPGLSDAETTYLFQLTGHLIDVATATLSSLIDVLTSDRLTLTDDERLARLNSIDEVSDRQLRFAIKMNNDVAVLGENQQSEHNNLELFQRLNP